MPRFSRDLFVESKVNRQANAFWDDEHLLFVSESSSAEAILKALTFRIGRKPKDLMAHLRRIFFCYQNALSEQLHAALLDFLIILNGKGRNLSMRLIHGCRSQLGPNQTQAFKRAISMPLKIPGNRYSLFTTGIVGTLRLLEVMPKNLQEQPDYLKLADDFIVFSQLEEAMSILELGLEAQPERQDLQTALLELYQSTRSRERFNDRYEAIKATGQPLANDWRRLADFFDGKAI